MESGELRTSIKVALIVSGTFLAMGILMSWIGVWTIQPFILKQPCASSLEDDTCCPTCLGLSTMEWGLYLAIPSIITIPTVLFSGLIIDVFGLVAATLLFTICSAIGSSLRALAAHFVHNHVVLIFLFIFGEVVIHSALSAVCASRGYLANRYFEPKWRPIAVGIMFGLSDLGMAAAGFIVPPLTVNTDVKVALWTLTGISCTPTISALCLMAIFCLSSQLKGKETELRDQELAGLRIQSPKKVLRSLTRFQPEFWLVFLGFGIFHSVFLTLDSNAPLLQMSLHNITAVQAGANMAWGYLGKTLSCCLVGFVISLTSYQLEISLLAWIVATVALTLMFVNPNVSLIFGMSSHGAFYACLQSIYGFYVPHESLGVASGLMLAITCIIFSVCGNVVGAIMHDHDRWFGAHVCLYFLTSLLLVSGIFILVLRCYFGNPNKMNQFDLRKSQNSETNENAEKQKILDEKAK